VPQAPAPAGNAGGIVVAMLVSILVLIALAGSVVALIRHSSEEE
jgi:flagellar basal body-associated protein FliL